MPIGKTELLDLLNAIDGALDRKIRINAVGGTALTLLGVKSSTLDVDFDANSKDSETLKKAIKLLNPGYKIDLFSNGMIFSQQLPSDYDKQCVPIPSKFRQIELFAISPLDIICSKIGRLNERDIQDIRMTIEKFKVTKDQVRKRAKLVGYAANDAIFAQNTKYVLENIFGK
ncbi:MAG: DUF6036 family nucleotidyltransferase [Candidatus Micrarchaeota archaeon]